MTRKRLSLWSLALLLSLGLYWFYHNFEYVSVTYKVGLQGKAARYPFLAAHALLRRMGIRVKESTTLPQTWVSQKTVVLIHEHIMLNQQPCLCITDLYRWVLAGGHLMMASTDLDTLSQSIFTTFPAHLKEENQGVEKQQTIPSSFTFGQDSLQVLFDPYLSLTESPLPNNFKKLREISSQGKVHLLMYSVGQGTVTVLSDVKFLQFKTIGTYDHAQFLWHLINLHDSVEEVLWIHLNQEEKTPSLATLLWQSMYPVIISTTILLFCGLWYASGRFGPLLPPPSPTRRRLLEHLQASGHFLWRQGQSQVLLHHTQQALLNRLGVSHPEWLHFTPEQLSQRLAQLSGLSATEIQESLSSSSRECSPTSFTRTIHILAQLRKIL